MSKSRGIERTGTGPHHRAPSVHSPPESRPSEDRDRDRFERATIAGRITARNAVDPLVPITRQVARMILSGPVASRSLRQLQMWGTEVILDFGLGPSRLLGTANTMNNTVVVYVRNHASVKDVVSTIVHESSHIHRSFRGAENTQLDEVRARSREFLHQNGRRPSRAERRDIWREVEELYAELPRRRFND